MAAAIENYLQSFRVRFQGSQLGHFFRWWLADLLELLPSTLKAKMQHARRRVMLRMSGNELIISMHESDSLQELEVLSLNPDSRLQQQQLHDLLVDRDLSEVARYLLLPESRVLRKEVILPMAAEANLRQALAFEMDRQTPFRVDDVFYDYRVLQRDREASQLRIELLVTLKQPLLREIELLTPLGMAPTGVDVAGADADGEGVPAGINLLPPDLRHRMVNRRSRTNIALAGAAALLIVFAMAQSIWLRQHQLNEVRDAIDEVREEAMQVQELRNEIKDASEAAGFMQTRRSSSPPTVVLLTEVTRLLPDDTFLDRLLIRQDSVQMQGKSQNAQRLIELVNQSPFFSDASFRGPTRLDTRTQKEIFDVTANLVSGAHR